MNKLTIIGNLTKTPELRTTATGLSVCSFTVAVNRRKTANNSNPEPDFFNVSAWRQLGENCAKFLEKGRKVCVVGSVSVRTWESNGNHGASLEVTAEDVEFLTPRETAQTTPVYPSPASPHTQNPAGFQQVETDELPF